MARIRIFRPSASTGSIHPTEVDAEWAIVDNPDGALLQVSTFGSDMRKMAPKVSQTIQIDRKIAGELLAAISRTFPGL